ncbi:MAG: N-acetylmuramoyl-L-alanine amidase [Pseudomonadota bacterium]
MSRVSKTGSAAVNLAFEPDSELVGRLHPSPNIEPRAADREPDLLLLHYTGFLDAEKAIDWLARPEARVSCHYVIDEAGAVTQMVPERLRAWHAGESCWHGERDINSCSVGIEIHNPGHTRGYPAFPDIQMQAVAALSRDIITRHAVPAERVLAHSDIAPHRKMDPGERFDWAWLAAQGIGHWVPPAPINGRPASNETEPDEALIQQLQRRLTEYGYHCPETGTYDARTAFVITAFQRHFRPERVDGLADASCIETLDALLAALPTDKRKEPNPRDRA